MEPVSGRRRFQFSNWTMLCAIAVMSICFTALRCGLIDRTSQMLTPLRSGMVLMRAEVLSEQIRNNAVCELDGRMTFFADSPFRVHLAQYSERVRFTKQTPFLVISSKAQLFGHPQKAVIGYRVSNESLRLFVEASEDAQGASYIYPGKLKVFAQANGDIEFLDAPVDIIKGHEVSSTDRVQAGGNIATNITSETRICAWCEWQPSK